MCDFESDSFDDDGDDLELLDLLANNDVNRHFQRTSQEYEEIKEEGVKIGPTHHEVDYEALTTYIYPVNYPVREYQYEIVKECFYDNVICAIPTGTGKTFISSCVMMNYYRWFPKSKIIFVAPTRPLVAQQIKAAVGMTDIAADDVAILLDKSRKNRPEIWNSKRVIFSTPQVIENDLKVGFCDPKSISLIVIDEAHRTRGNYAYNNIIKFISRFTRSFRVLALTATPGADIVSVQEVVTNLFASKIEIRTENSPDIEKYMKHKEIDKRVVDLNQDINDIVDLLSDAIRPALEIANQKKIYEDTEASRINAFKALEASQRVINNPRYPEGLKWYLYFILQILTYVGQMLRRLKVYGIKTFYMYLENKYKEFTAKYDLGKSTNKVAAEFYYHPSIKQILDEYKDKVLDNSYIGHPKLGILVEELTDFFHDSRKNNTNSRVIIFTEMRESALEIVRAIDSIGDPNLLKPHIFIGQSREKEKFDDVTFREKNKPKGRGRKNQAQLEQQEEERRMKEIDKYDTKRKEKAEREARRTGLSENAQITGMTQKQQKKLISDFKHGIYNILVATSIGEEGLDIGEVDLIVCYDATSSPIKNIQRMGRTGRRKDGKVLLLLTETENTKFTKSMNSYGVVQKQISEGGHIQYCEPDRIIPPGYNPVCENKFIQEDSEFAEQEEEEEIIKLATQHMNGKASKRKTKKDKYADKRSIENLLTKAPKKRFFMPDNVETGFRAASAMVRKQGSSASLEDRKGKKRKSDIMDILDDNGDDNVFNQASDFSKRPKTLGNEHVEKQGERELDKHVQTPVGSEKYEDENHEEHVIHLSDDEDDKQSSNSETPILETSSRLASVEVSSLDKPEEPRSNGDSNNLHGLNRLSLDKSVENDFDDSFSDMFSDDEPVNMIKEPSTTSVELSKSIKDSSKPMTLLKSKPEAQSDNQTKSLIAVSNGTAAGQSIILSQDDDIRIEKVVKMLMGKDITDMIKQTIGALGIKNNKIVTNTLKRRTLGVKRRSARTQMNDEELIKMMNDREYERIEAEKAAKEKRREELEQMKKFEKEKEIQRKRTELKKKRERIKQDFEANRILKTEPDLKLMNDLVYPMKFCKRSGFINQKQEVELFKQYNQVKSDLSELADPLIPYRSDAASNKFCNISHSSKTQRLVATHILMRPRDFSTDGHRELRKLVIAQKRYELAQKK